MDFVKYDDASLFEKVKKARNTYIHDLQIANDTYKDSVAVAKKMYQRDFIGSAIETAKSGFEKERTRIEYKFLSDCEEMIASAERTVTSRLEKRDANKINEVRMLRGMKITPREFAVIAKRHSLTLDYFASKELRELAEQNNIVVEDLPETVKLLPSFDEQMDCLAELRQECEDFIAKFNPDIESVNDLMLLSDRKLTVWENKFTNGLRSVSQLSDDAKIRRSMVKIEGCANEAKKGTAIREELSSVDDGLRARLLFEIADSRIVSDIAVKMSGCADEIEAFRNGGSREYKEAVSAMEKVKSADTSLHAKKIARANRHNKYFTSELKREAVNDSKLQDVSEFVGECLADDAETDG